MIVSKILHDKAMEFVDLAKISNMEGNSSGAMDFYEKAFALEVEAIEKLPTENMDDITPYLYRRSAAWLAFQCGHFSEAKEIASIALAGNPPGFIQQQLEELLQELAEVFPNGQRNEKKRAETSVFKTKILTTLEQLEQTNRLIAYHHLSKKPDQNAIRNFQSMKNGFLQQLAELLKAYEVEVKLPVAA